MREAGAHHLLDLNLDYFRRTGGISNFDNSAGRFKTFWNSGGVDLVFRRSLGDFDDPLRLFADFRSQHDKRGIRIDQRLGKIRVVAIGLRGYPGRGAEHGQAARFTGQVTQDLEVGLSYARRNLNQAPFASLDSRVGGLDLRWRVSGRQQWAFEHAISQASGDAPVQPRGTGRGDRLSWSYRMDNGLSTRLGYLDLSPDYNAAFSDPGNQISTDVHGPEATLSWRHPGTLGSISGLSVNGNLFYYQRRRNPGDINQIDLTAQGRVVDRLDLSTNLRSREEDGQRTTSVLLTSRAPLSGTWYGDLQYNANIAPGVLTQRILAGFSEQGGLEHYRRLQLEIDSRHGDALANAPVYEYGLHFSGREAHFSYESNLRYTHSGSGVGTNLFVKLAYDVLWLHRYAPLVYISIGDRSALRTAGRVETGMELRF